MRASTPLKRHNVGLFLRRFVKHIPAEELEEIPTGLYGNSFVFAYGDDKILKVNKPKTRPELLKEAALNRYLAAQDLPVEIAAPLEVHPEGFYAVYPRLKGESLTSERLNGLSADELQRFCRPLAEFLAFLHGHDFPQAVEKLVPREEEDLSAGPRYAERNLDFIRRHAPAVDLSAWEAGLEKLRDVAEKQVLCINHGDISFSNVLVDPDDPGRLAVIDFNDAEVCDASLDLSGFAEELAGEDVEAGPFVEALLRHYGGDVELMRRKIEFRLLLREIYAVFRRVRRRVRLEGRGAAMS